LTLRVTGGSAAAGAIAADVYVDGKRVGKAPIDRYPVVPGQRRIRFDCIFEGKTHRGKERSVDVPEYADAVIEHQCDVWVTLGRDPP